MGFNVWNIVSFKNNNEREIKLVFERTNSDSQHPYVFPKL